MSKIVDYLKVGDIAITTHATSSPQVPIGTVLQLTHREHGSDIWHTCKFLRADELVFIHWHALELYWRPDAER
jgi:hypothetical protein